MIHVETRKKMLSGSSLQGIMKYINYFSASKEQYRPNFKCVFPIKHTLEISSITSNNYRVLMQHINLLIATRATRSFQTEDDILLCSWPDSTRLEASWMSALCFPIRHIFFLSMASGRCANSSDPQLWALTLFDVGANCLSQLDMTLFCSSRATRQLWQPETTNLAYYSTFCNCPIFFLNIHSKNTFMHNNKEFRFFQFNR